MSTTVRNVVDRTISILRRHPRRAAGARGFTLVELIIVVIILGILAALAIPQFTASTSDARQSTLKGDLAVLRNAINLYFHEHNEQYPGALSETGDGSATTSSNQTDAFTHQLLQYTDKQGKTSATKDAANFPYGPYLVALPANPVAVAGATADAVTVTDEAGPLTADAAPTTGWKYSKVTGQIIANNAEYEGL